MPKFRTEDDINLKLLWLNPNDDPNHKIDIVDYSHCHTINNVMHYCSTNDHFNANERLFMAVSEAGVLHCGQN